MTRWCQSSTGYSHVVWLGLLRRSVCHKNIDLSMQANCRLNSTFTEEISETSTTSPVTRPGPSNCSTIVLRTD